MKSMQKFISLWLTLCLVLSMIPIQVFAQETASEPVAAEETVAEETTAAEADAEESQAAEETVSPTLAEAREDGQEDTAPQATAGSDYEILQEHVTQEAKNAETTASGTCGENLTWTLDSEGVLTISGTGAMSGHSWEDRGLTSVIIEEGVTSISRGAFSWNHKLIRVSIPSTLTYIDTDAFFSCPNLKNVYISDVAAWCNIRFVDLLSNPFYYASYMYLNGELLKDLVIPETVTTLKNNAFMGATNLETVTIPESVTYVGSDAFRRCSSLTDIYFAGDEARWKYISADCGYDAEQITVHYGIPNSSGTYGENVTWFHDSTTGTLTVTGTGAVPNTRYGEHTPWYYIRDSITAIVVEEGITSIGNAFLDCAKAEAVQLPSTLKEIGGSAFGRCTLLTSIEIPEGVEKIGIGAFAECSNLSSIVIPSGVTDIGSEVFRGCEKLTDVSLPEGMTEIPESFFEGCIALNTITLPQSVESIGVGVFSGCSSLQEIQLPEKLKSIGNCAFSLCSSLQEIQIPETVESIGSEIFYGCSSLTEVSLPYGLKNVTSILRSLFYECANLTSITVPQNVTTIECWAFYGCTSLTSITLPKSLTTIEGTAFGNCNALTDVYYTGTEEQWAALLATTDETTNAPLFNEELQVHCNWVEEPEQSLRFPIDYWTFENHNSVFGDAADGYFITQADYDRLVLNLPKPTPDYPAYEYYSVTMKQNSESLDTFRRYNIHDPLILRYDGVDYPVREWSGSCYGMSTWTSLVNNGVLQASDIDGTTQKLSDYTFNQDVESAINFYQWQQELSAVYGATTSWSNNDQEQQLRHLETLGKAANETGEVFVVLFHWYELETNDNGDEYFENYAHAVNGYGWEQIEPRTITVNGHTATYDKRILIYDCSDPNEEFDNHIYYNDEYICCIPAWDFSSLDRNITESLTDLSNNGQLQYATKDPQFLNLIDYRTGEANLEPDLTRVQSDMGVAYQLECEGETYQVTATSIRGGSTENKPMLWFMTNIHADRSASAESAMTILPQGVHSCSISSEDTLEFRFITPETAAMVSANQSGKVQFHQNGTVSMETRNPADYDIMMQLQASANTLPWTQIRLQGSSASKVFTDSTESGIVITADHMENVSVAVSSDEGTQTITLTADQKVLLTEKDGEPVFLQDSNNDGIFEEEHQDCSDGHIEETIIGTEATCTENGLTDGKKCAVCGIVTIVQQPIPATGHTDVTIPGKTATCTATGLTEGKKCSVCGTVTLAQKTIPAKGHTYDDNVDGTCNVCGVNRETVEFRQVTHMFRMYNPNTGEHFYTGSEVERQNLVDVGWNYEGVGFTFPANTGAPVHRLFQESTGEHLYTMDETEKAKLEAEGWNYEGIAFNSAYDTEAVQHRLHNPNATVGAYHFTFSLEEKQNLIDAGWEYQGIGWYSCWK